MFNNFKVTYYPLKDSDNFEGTCPEDVAMNEESAAP
jgi:hypothetical protein